MTPIEKIKADHRYILTNLYKVQAGKDADGRDESYWRGALNGIEGAMDALGIEHEKYSPFGYMEYAG